MKNIQLTLNADYIVEDEELCKKLNKVFEDKQNRVIILEAPQGTGKSKLINELEHVYLSPTKLLVEQQYNEFGGVLSKGIIKQYAEFIGASEDDYGDVLLDDKNQKTTFASSNTAELNAKKWFIIDEAHKLCDFSSFAYESVMNTVIQSIRHYKGGGNLLFISATPENFIEDIVKYYEKQGVQFNSYVKIVPHYSRKYVNTLYIFDCRTTNDFFKTIKQKERLNYSSGKQVGLLSNKEMIKGITSELLGEGLSAIGIDSKNRQKSINEGGTKEYFSELVETKKMTHQIMNFTSFVDTGVSFEDTDIKNLYCMMPAEKTNITIAKQFICRARNSKPNAYMKLEHIDETDKKKLCIDKLKLQSLFETRAKQQIEAYQSGLIEESELVTTVGVVKIGTKYVCSTIAIMQEIRSLQEKFKLSTFEGFKETFKDYYEKIELLSDINGIEGDILEKTKVFMRQYTGRKLGIKETTIIMDYLHSIGIEGKKFSLIVKKVGFESKSINKKGNHILYEED